MKSEIKYITINGIQHFVKIVGDIYKQIPIIAVHGGPGGHHYAFEHTSGKLLEEFAPVIYYEQRGCGRSSAPDDIYAYGINILIDDLNKLLINLKLDKVILYGYSFGAELCLHYAKQYPKKILGVIAQAPSDMTDIPYMANIQYEGFQSVATDEEKQALKYLHESNPSSQDLFMKIWDVVSIDTMNKFMFYKIANAMKMRELWAEAQLMNTGLMMEALLNNQYVPSLMDGLHIIESKTLIIIGRYDKNCGIALAKRIQSNMSDCTIDVFDHSGHFPDFEEKYRFAEVVHLFYRSIA